MSNRFKNFTPPITYLSQNILLLCFISAIHIPNLTAQSASEKAQMIVNIAKGLTFPPSSNTNFTIGVLDSKEVDKELTTLLNGQKLGNRPVEVKRFSFNFQVKPCDILFIGSNSTSNSFFDGIRKKTDGTSTLIITETKGMLEKGSHINLILASPLRYEINPPAIQELGISVSSATQSNAVQGNIIIIKEKSDEEKASLKEKILGKKNEETNQEVAETEVVSEKNKRKTNRRNRSNEEIQATEVELVNSQALLEKAAGSKDKQDKQTEVLKRYIAALEQKLDENKIDYQNLKMEYQTEHEKITNEIAALNLTIIEKDSLRKKDAMIAQKKIELAESEKKIALAQSKTNLYFALMASSIAIGFLIAAFIFYRDRLIISRQKNQLAENLEEITQQKEEIEAQKEEIEAQNNKLEEEKQKSDRLLLNILPAETAYELKETGQATPRQYELASVLFTDFKGFTQIAEKLTPEQVIQELDKCFLAFDEIVEKYNMERIKTIGDSYMAVGGLPTANTTNPIDAVKAGLEIQAFMNRWKQEKIEAGLPFFECRLGIHTGKVIAGVVGKKKFAYDIWGDTVNTASRMESSSEVNEVNISGTTYELIKDAFECSYRGKINAKGKGEIDMYFVKNEK